MRSKPGQIHIVGHGLTGCVLAMTLYRRNVPFILYGHSRPGEASMASSGLIAPVTGRRYVKAWRIDDFIPYSLEFYRYTESLLGQAYFFPIEIVRFLSHPEAKAAWEKRCQDPEYAAYISDRKEGSLDIFNKPYGILTGAYRLDTPGWIGAVRSFFQRQGYFSPVQLRLSDTHPSDDLVVFATGAMDPQITTGIVPNKGESLIVRMPQWNIRQAVKDEVFIVPLRERDHFWIGSFYQPGESDPNPTSAGRDRLLLALRKWNTGPVDVIAHYAGIRPTVEDRRPLVGAMPGRQGRYMLNGMGTKGTSLAPFWAAQLAAHLTENLPLPPEVSPARYS